MIEVHHCGKPWWRHQIETFPRNWPFVQGINRYQVNSPHIGHWRGALMFSLICVCINSWVNKKSWGWWFETLSRQLWRHCYGSVLYFYPDTSSISAYAISAIHYRDGLPPTAVYQYVAIKPTLAISEWFIGADDNRVLEYGILGKSKNITEILKAMIPYLGIPR